MEHHESEQQQVWSKLHSAKPFVNSGEPNEFVRKYYGLLPSGASILSLGSGHLRTEVNALQAGYNIVAIDWIEPPKVDELLPPDTLPVNPHSIIKRSKTFEESITGFKRWYYNIYNDEQDFEEGKNSSYMTVYQADISKAIDYLRGPGTDSESLIPIDDSFKEKALNGFRFFISNGMYSLPDHLIKDEFDNTFSSMFKYGLDIESIIEGIAPSNSQRYASFMDAYEEWVRRSDENGYQMVILDRILQYLSPEFRPKLVGRIGELTSNGAGVVLDYVVASEQFDTEFGITAYPHPWRDVVDEFEEAGMPLRELHFVKKRSEYVDPPSYRQIAQMAFIKPGKSAQ